MDRAQRALFVASAMFIAACAESAPSSVPVALAPAVVGASDAAATRAIPSVGDTGAASAYLLDVEIVASPLAATSLLARIEENGGGVDPAADCRERLVAHARRLGANALYVEPAMEDSRSCAGMAYQVRRLTSAQRSALAEWSHEISTWLVMRWDIPASIPDRDRAKLCVVYQFQVNRLTRIVFVRKDPIRSSGNAAFDESARMLLEQVMAEGARLPEPPNVLAPGGGFMTVRVPLVGGRDASCG